MTMKLGDCLLSTVRVSLFTYYRSVVGLDPLG